MVLPPHILPHISLRRVQQGVRLETNKNKKLINKKMKRLLLILLAVSLSATIATAQTSREEIDAHPHIALASHSVYAGAYFFRPIADAPKGYKPFYISHYGRHGSRHESHVKHPNALLKIARTADKLGILTAKGKEMLAAAEHISKAHHNRIGELTRLGVEQHKAIARRMYSRFKPVFHSGAIIDSRSSNWVRCVLSMAAFNESLKECQPMLETHMEAAEEHQSVIRPVRGQTTDYGHHKREIAKHSWDEMFSKWADSRDFTHAKNTLFTDIEPLCKALGKKEIYIMREIYARMAFMQNLGQHDRTLIDSIFTPEERHTLYLYENFRWYALYYSTVLEDSKRYFAPFYHLIDDVVKNADLAIEGKNSASANLRFGHDYYLLGLLAILNPNEMRSDLDFSDIERFGEIWRSYRIVSMASNVQFVFYRSKKSEDVLVRILENENDITLPIKSVEGPFYKWSDLRSYLNARMDLFRK